jgi:predicted transcriptional regulator
MITEKIIGKMKTDIEALAIKKRWKINENGNKVKIVRKSETEFDSYLNGNYITTNENWEQAFEMAKTLLAS